MKRLRYFHADSKAYPSLREVVEVLADGTRITALGFAVTIHSE